MCRPIALAPHAACRRVCFSLRYLSARVSRSLACCSVPGWFPFPIAGYAVCLETSEEYDLRTAFVASPSVLAVPALLLAQQNPSASGFLKRFVFFQQFPFPYRSIAVKRVLVLSLIVLFPVSARAQERTPNAEVSEKKSEEHTSELQSHSDLVCRLLLEKKKKSGTTLKSYGYANEPIQNPSIGERTCNAGNVT